MGRWEEPPSWFRENWGLLCKCPSGDLGQESQASSCLRKGPPLPGGTIERVILHLPDTAVCTRSTRSQTEGLWGQRYLSYSPQGPQQWLAHGRSYWFEWTHRWLSDREKSYSSLVKTLVVDSIINILSFSFRSFSKYLFIKCPPCTRHWGYSGEEVRQGICPYRAYSLREETK